MPRLTANLDALIPRADFAANDGQGNQSSDNFQQIHLHNLVGENNFIYRLLRKPDFQRETNQWSPQQIATLVESFLEGELIPSIILWRSATSHLFVIDGGHRLSALIAWASDDYGDSTASHIFFKNEIPDHQKKSADRTRRELHTRVGTYAQWKERSKNLDAITDPDVRRRSGNFSVRGLHVQWINGDADKAESSFFKINSQGTARDPIETKILRNRKKPPALVARSIARAATGHAYWSRFPVETQDKITSQAKKAHQLLFNPEVKNPIRTIDLPIGGSASTARALDLIISIAQISDPQHQSLKATKDDLDGEATVIQLRYTRRLLERITGNEPSSLGLHPTVWFYNQQGRQNEHLLLATLGIFQRKIQARQSNFFKYFTLHRREIEKFLVDNKDILSRFVSAVASKNRQARATDMLSAIIDAAMSGDGMPTIEQIAQTMKLGSRAIIISEQVGQEFTEEIKSAAFLRGALASAIKCPICDSYLEPSRSVTYDHRKDKKDGGNGSLENCDLAHPYCNSAKDELTPLFQKKNS